MVSTNLWKAQSICNKRIPPWKSYQKNTKTVFRRINSKYLQLRKHNVFAKEIVHFCDCVVGAVTCHKRSTSFVGIHSESFSF